MSGAWKRASEVSSWLLFEIKKKYLNELEGNKLVHVIPFWSLSSLCLILAVYYFVLNRWLFILELSEMEFSLLREFEITNTHYKLFLLNIPILLQAPS